MNAVDVVSSRIRRKFTELARMGKLRKVIGSASDPRRSLKSLFNAFTDEEWFWANTEGLRRFPELRNLLPGAPDETTQANFVGSSGDAALREGFAAYTLFKRTFETHVGALDGRRTVLDFGCGWGRIIRFFLKDVEPENLWGADCYPEIIEICKNTNSLCQFRLIEPRPKTSFNDNTFDLIYCYSVFSHLAEDIHREWLREFARILKPGGLLIATTQAREFINWCADLRDDPSKQLTAWHRTLAKAFGDRDRWLEDYDSGKFCHQGTGGAASWKARSTGRPASRRGMSSTTGRSTSGSWTSSPTGRCAPRT